MLGFSGVLLSCRDGVDFQVEEEISFAYASENDGFDRKTKEVDDGDQGFDPEESGPSQGGKLSGENEVSLNYTRKCVEYWKGSSSRKKKYSFETVESKF